MTREAVANDPSGAVINFIESYCLGAADYLPSKYILTITSNGMSIFIRNRD